MPSRHQIQNFKSVTVREEKYVGPLPPSSALNEYDHIYPGAAKAIIDNFIAQSEHRRSLEKIVIRAGSRDSLLGIISGFVIGMTTVIWIYRLYHA